MVLSSSVQGLRRRGSRQHGEWRNGRKRRGGIKNRRRSRSELRRYNKGNGQWCFVCENICDVVHKRQKKTGDRMKTIHTLM